MKRIYTLLTIALTGSLALLSTSCIKEINGNDPLELVGTPIVFSAATSYDNGVATRAEYSGDLVGTTSKTERIDWKANDPIKIVYSGASDPGAYKVSANGSAEGKDSRATLTDGYLEWGAGSPHVFYAWYPNNANGSLDANGKVTGTIPANQSVNTSNTLSPTPTDCDIKYQPDTKNYGFMFGYLSLTAPAATVELPFKPAFTTLEFKLKRKAGDADKKVKTIAVSTADETNGTPLTGTFSFTIPAGSTPTLPAQNQITTSGTGKTITLDFSGFTGGGVTIPEDKFLDFSVLCLPVDQQYVKVVFTYTDNTVKKLSLKDKDNGGAWIKFTGGKKYIITNDNVPGGEDWEYYLDPISDLVTYGRYATTASLPFNVTSYKVKGGTTTQVPVAWHIQYSTDGSTWSDSPDDKINVNVTDGDESTVTTANGANVVRHHTDTEYTGDAPYDVDGSTAALRSAEDIPAAAKDADGYYDLSKHPVYGDNQFGSPQSMETANCYVIQGPGLYKFPLVYGNAIRGGSANTESYDVSSQATTDNATYFVGHFQRHDSQPITNPWIKNNGYTVDNAIIVWQDGTTNADGVIIQDSKVSVDGDYIKFEVERDRIRPGNVVIAARCGSTIVWSWHIWVTEKDLTPKAITDYLGNTNWMMEYNLGWMDATNARSTKWNDWTMYVRVTQAESGKQVTFKVSQIGPVISVDSNVGSNTYYQWGRKDPMLPAAFNNSDKAQYSKHGLLWEKSTTHMVGTGASNFGHAIQHPNWQYISMVDGHDVNGDYWPGYSYFGNLWDSGLKNTGSVADFGKRFPVKTVYDPCPRGFVVPYEYAFTGFQKVSETNPFEYAYLNQRTYPSNGTTVKYNVISGTLLTDGFRFKDPNGVIIYFPFCGARAHDGNHGNTGNSVYDVSTLGYYWTACPSKYNSTSNYSGVEGRMTAKMMILVKDGDDSYIRVAHEQRKGAAYAVRPVLEIVED